MERTSTRVKLRLPTDRCICSGWGTHFAFGFPTTSKQEKHRHSVGEIDVDQLLRRTAILRPQSRQDFLPRIC